MPTNTSFKVQCPSCEAQVPVRDPALVGKKIDCPKCKYRFVVEDPNDEGFDEEREPRKGAKGKGKKKAGNNNVLILGSVLGVVAVILLGVGAYFLFFNGDSSAKPAASNPNPPSIPKTNLAAAENTGGATPGATPNTPNDHSTPGTPTNQNPNATVADGSLPAGQPTHIPNGNITNLLPNDAQAVYSIHMEKFRACTLGQQAFESRVGFKPETFKQKLGIDVAEIDKFVRAESLEGNWSFNAFHTIRPVTLDELKSALGLEKASKSPIQGREYYKLAPNDLLDNLATILHSELEMRSARGGAGGGAAGSGNSPENTPRRSKVGPLTILQVNPTTFVIATQEPMEEFLQNGGKWEMKSIPAPGAGDGATDADAASPPQPARPAVRGGADGSAAGGTGAQYTQRPTWLSVEPALKSMMDRLEGDGKNVIATLAVRLQSNPNVIARLRDATGLQTLQVNGMNVLGVALSDYDARKFKAHADLEMFRATDAKLLEDQIKEVLPAAGVALGLYLGGLKIDVEGAAGGGGGAGAGPGGGRGGPGAPGQSALGGGGAGPDSGGGGSGGSGQEKNTLGLARTRNILTLSTNLNMTEKAYDRMYGLGERIVIRMKGMVDMADASPHWHTLANAAVAARGQDGVVPRGTYVREDTMGGRLIRNFPPHQRVGWLVSMLPFMGHEDLYQRIDRKKSWRDDENLKQGAILVPEFLNPSFDRRSWRASVPSLGLRDQGATHVVGMAGIGPDAADYSFNDPSVAKKIGMVGYDRRVKMSDVTDGAANTIYMIQVPPSQPRPWIAGGGASITGVPEKDSVRPFVVTSGGKRGATVIMADGSVRFVAETISDDVFKALCTIRGGEELVDLDKQVPKVDPPKRRNELRTASSGGGDKPQQPPGEVK